MSRIFRDSESSGKSNGTKGSQICKLLLIKGVKLPRKKCLFLVKFCMTEQDFFWYRFFFTLFNGLFAPNSPGPMSELLRFLGSLGKSNGKKWSHI